MKKAKFILLWSVIAIYLVGTLGFVAERRSHLVCNTVEVNIVDSLRNGFVTESSIKNLLLKRGINLIGRNFGKIYLDSLETILNAYPPVEKAEVYKTNEGRVVIDIRQRNPIVRIIDANNVSYYIDNKGFLMRLSGNFTSRVIIANGFINSKFPNYQVNVFNLERKSNGKRVILTDIFRLATYISNNKFWSAQIQQIYVNENGEFELVPRVGSQIILFGDFTNCEEKFDNLMSMYKNAFPAVGWNKYESINLKYKGQVICTKREPL
jgi:cell division protein FtsQ